MGPFQVWSFMKILLVSPKLDQKEQNWFRPLQFYSSIVPMPTIIEYSNEILSET